MPPGTWISRTRDKPSSTNVLGRLRSLARITRAPASSKPGMSTVAAAPEQDYDRDDGVTWTDPPDRVDQSARLLDRRQVFQPSMRTPVLAIAASAASRATLTSCGLAVAASTGIAVLLIGTPRGPPRGSARVSRLHPPTRADRDAA
ncbi:MAG: hypothetical protein ACRDPG_13075, partial [Nocardioidaceae bacterium]